MKERTGRVASWEEIDKGLDWGLKELGFQLQKSLEFWLADERKIDEEKKESDDGVVEAAIVGEVEEALRCSLGSTDGFVIHSR